MQSKKRERDGDDSQNTSKRISHGPGGVLNFDEVKPLVEKPVNVAPKVGSFLKNFLGSGLMSLFRKVPA